MLYAVPSITLNFHCTKSYKVRSITGAVPESSDSRGLHDLPRNLAIWRFVWFDTRQ